jgi:hypothetical protein
MLGGWGCANAVTAPVTIASEKDDNDMALSFTYNAETGAVAVTPAKVVSRHPSNSISARGRRRGCGFARDDNEKERLTIIDFCWSAS